MQPPSCSRMYTEHQSKRLRTSPPPTPDDARNCYLGTVPDEILRIVLRFLSRRPQHQNWHRYTSPLSVNTALDVGGALARAASLEFRSIGGRVGVPLDSPHDASILRPLVHRLSLHRLVLKLDGGQALPDLLRRCGAELRELDLDAYGTAVTEADILAISAHCTNLSSLAIDGNRFEGMLTPIWRSIGSTLTRIYFGHYNCAFGNGIVDAISVPDFVEHCVNLRRVDVGMLNHAYADVLIALGSRIRVLNIEDELDSDFAPWRDVFAACTNLEEVHLALDDSDEAIDALALMRLKLVSLTLYRRGDLAPPEDHFFSVLSACSLLKEVEFRVLQMSPEALRKLFESMKSVTTLTCLMGSSSVNPKENIIDVAACHLTSLETFTLSTRKSLKGEDVDALVRLPCLKSVTLRRRYPEKSVLKVVEVVKRLKHCPQLVQLDIDYNRWSRAPLIAEAAAAYNRKDFDMFIGGVQYRTW